MDFVIDKNGAGYIGLLTDESNKNILVESKSMDGYFVDELGIVFQIGDIFKVKTPFTDKEVRGYHISSDIKVYKVTGTQYHCEFI